MNAHLLIQKIKLKCSDILVEFVVVMAEGFKNNILKQIYTVVIASELVIAIVTVVNLILGIGKPITYEYLVRLVLLSIVYFILVIIPMILVLLDKILAEAKSRNLATKINSIIKTELDNSKFNPKHQKEGENAKS